VSEPINTLVTIVEHYLDGETCIGQVVLELLPAQFQPFIDRINLYLEDNTKDTFDTHEEGLQFYWNFPQKDRIAYDPIDGQPYNYKIVEWYQND